MKILHIDPDDLDRPESGGSPIRTFEIYRRLADRHDVTVLTPNFEESKKVQIKEGIKFVRVGDKFRNHRSTYYFSFYALAPFEVRKHNYDLLVEDLMPPADVTITPLLNKKAPIIASVQWFFAEIVSRKLMFPFHLFRKIGIKNYDNFIALTGDMETKIRTLHPSANIQVIPNGIDSALFDTTPVYDDFILFLGRLDQLHKGVDILIESFNKIANQTDVDLVVAGAGTSEDLMRNLVLKYNLEKRVRFVGKVGFEKKQELLSKCRFVAMPSRHETFGMVSTESFACTKTVVAFDIPNLGNVARKDHAVIVEPFDCDAYAKALLMLLNDKQKCIVLGEKAKIFAEDYMWDSVACMQEQFYFECLKAQK